MEYFTLGRFNVGQNFASRGTTGDVNEITIESLMELWSDEVNQFDRNVISAYR